ncbi:MAG: ABC transporter substrate-binding protein [Prolixibacteraceae bacterium]|nr:ABC transporter substrate-binding protein [Prolixibacteraceae bacterium]
MKLKFKFAKILIVLLTIGSINFSCNNNKTSNTTSAKMNLVLIQYNDSPLSDLSREGILEGMKQYGYTEGTDFKLDAKNAQGDISTLNLIVDGVLNDKPDLVFVTSTPTLQVVAKKITDIPVVFTVIADPVVAGAGTSFTSHLPNFTGISTMGAYKEMVHWLKEIMPDIKTIGTLFSPGEANAVKNVSELEKYAGEAGIEVVTVPVNSSSEVVDATLALASKKPEIICQVIDNLTSAAFSGIAKIAAEQKIPIFGFEDDQINKGAVFVVSRNYTQAGIDAVRLADKIFKGADPDTIPFEFVSKTDIKLNLDAAEKYGIQIPTSILNNKDIILVKK